MVPQAVERSQIVDWECDLQSNVHTLLLVHPQVRLHGISFYEQFLTPLKFLQLCQMVIAKNTIEG